MEQSTDKALTELRQMFALSRAVFEATFLVEQAFNPHATRSPMHLLHDVMHAELYKENPDKEILTGLLYQMEQLAEQNNGTGEKSIGSL